MLILFETLIIILFNFSFFKTFVLPFRKRNFLFYNIISLLLLLYIYAYLNSFKALILY